MNLADYKLHIIVEDDGLKYFLDETLGLTLLPTKLVDVVAGGGWTNMLARYNELVEKGVDPNKIVPILDGDTVSDKNPTSGNEMLKNDNLIRLYKDLEYAFDNWMIAEAIIEFDTLLFGGRRSPRTFLICLGMVSSARTSSIKKRITLYSALSNEFKDYFEREGGERSAYVLPSKVQLAKKVAEISSRSGIFPEQLGGVMQHVEQVASDKGIELISVQPQLVSHITEYEKEEPALRGKILISTGGRFLWIFDLDLHKFYSVPYDDKVNLGKASWSHDGSLIACAAKGKGIIIMKTNGSDARTLSRKVLHGYEVNPCWFPTGDSILVATELGLCKKNLSSIDWPIVFPTDHGTIADNCISKTGRIAVNHYNQNDGKYYLQIGGRGAAMDYERVPDIQDTRAGVSWSPNGQTVAFVNHIDSERGAVCIYDHGTKETQYLSSHDGFPRFVSFSPDGRFIVYTWREAKTNYQELRAIEVATRRIIVLKTNVSDLVIGCHAWKF